MPYLGTQPNNVKQNTGLYTPSEILQLTKDGHWGGSLELLLDSNPSSASSVAFTDLKTSQYKVHVLQFSNIFASANGDQPVLRFSNDGGSSYEAGSTDYQYGMQVSATHSFFGESRSSGATALFSILGRGGSTAIRKNNSYVYLYNLGSSSTYSYITTHSMGTDDAGNFINLWGGGMYRTIETINAVQFIYTSGANITGNIKLFGLKQ